MAELSDPQIERGRRLVLLVVFITFGYEALSILYYAVVTAQMFGTPVLPLNLEVVVRLALEAGLLYCVYKGYSWARWVAGILFALGALLGCLPALQIFSAGPAVGLQGDRLSLIWGGLLLLGTMLFAYAASAAILLASESVRAFQAAQRR
jgi:hypothetical protein